MPTERVLEILAADAGTRLDSESIAALRAMLAAGAGAGSALAGVVPYSGGGGGRMSNLLWENRPLPPMARLLLSTLIEDASASDDATVSRVVRTLLRSPVTDAERVGERLCVFGWECSRPGGEAISWRYKVVGADSGTEYVSFGLAMPTGPDLLLSVFGLQLQIALNGLASTSEEEVGCFMELMAAVRAA